MNYRQQTERKTARQLRSQGIMSLRGKWGMAILAMLIAGVLGARLSMGGGGGMVVSFEVRDFLPDWNLVQSVDELGAYIKDAIAFVNYSLATPLNLMFTWITALGSLVFTLFVGTALRIGHLRFRLHMIDGERADLAKVFSGFDRSYLPAIGLRLLRTLYLFLWGLPSLLFLGIAIAVMILFLFGFGYDFLIVSLLSLLFCLAFSILPIIAQYRYAMSDYIMAENPNVTVSGALRESAAMMRGNKWRLFCLQLSFIGWDILCAIPCGLGFLWLFPYQFQAEAAFYHEISGREAIREAVVDMKELMEQL